MASKEEIQIILDAQLKNSQKTIEAVKKLEKNIKGADKSIKEAEKSTKFFSTTLGKIAGAVGLGYAINSVKNFTASIIKSRGEMEQYEIAFEVMLGSAEEAGKLLEEITEFAEKTPFELNGLVKSSKELLAFGVEADKVIPTLETLGNIASGTNVDISRLTFVFGQVKTAGKLFAQDLNQFTQAGVPLISALAKEMNIAEEEVKQFGSEGKIAFEDVERALKTLGNTKFANLMKRQNDTVLGQFSNLQDVIGEFTRSLGKPLEGVVKKTTQSLIGFFERLVKTVEENEDAIREWAEGFMEGVFAVFNVLKRFGGYAIDFFSNSFVQAVGVALVAWKGFASAMTLSLGGITKALALVGGAIAYINSKIESGIDKTFKSVSDTAKSLKGTYDQLKNSFGGALGFNVENKTTTTTAEVSTKTTKEQKKKTGQDEKAKEKKLKDDLLAIEQDFNTKRAKSRASFREKEKEIRDLAYEDEMLGILNKEAFDAEIKQNEIDRIKAQNELINEEEALKLEKLRELKGENDALVLEMEAEQADRKLEQDIEISEKQHELDVLNKNRRHELEVKAGNLELLRKKIYDTKVFKQANNIANDLVGLERNKNSKLRSVGEAMATFQKAQAIFEIGVQTEKAAMSAYAALAPIPFVGPALGAIAAGLAIAYGAQRMQEVKANSFAVGSPNIEQDQLANVHKGEIIVPKTFSDGLRDGDLMLGNAKSLDNQQTEEQRGGLTIINNFEGANFYGVADKDEMIKEMSEAISENIADGIIQPFPTEQI